MDYQFENSVKRAGKLLNTPVDYQDYLLLKLSFNPFSCHHLRHWPDTWEQINKYIAPSGPIADEGDVLIEKNGNKFVLELHESGPEIIVYLAVATAVASLTKSIIDLAIVIIKSFSNENRGRSSGIKITRKQFVQGKFKEEVIEIDIPISKEKGKKLEGEIKKLLKSH